ncbi:TonB-linked outer membrane protein, SusC/RagA family [Chryseobacterium wanjuense]|uniref:TonB-linked outer membrane protein, SusC/RagA family n=1 Tax=Chryseobacterium wanjuense TaxID=356305 RepID=A0A1I0QDF0_9FLAO|nr:SusC/RagA family TonB-linked outer membrane protein [Chryseobacterium wanjuense]SEW24919.1 TonB-linked outer membrane protein, SusC/RagA family [Chryseobacterium wanjuense]
MQTIVKPAQTCLCLLILLLLLLYPDLQMKGYSSTFQDKISISVRDASLADLLRQIAKKAETTIWFKNDDVSSYRGISYEAKNKTVDEILHQLLDNKGFLVTDLGNNSFGIKKKTETNLMAAPMDTIALVRGKITDERGTPLIGANILIKGTGKGASTGNDGSFMISNVKISSRTAVVSMVGYSTIESQIPGSNFLSVSLKAVSSILDEAIIVAYGTKIKRFATENTISIKSKDIENQPVGNPMLALQGRVPGLMIEQASGFAGSGVKVRLQGQNSISRGNDPFYVIDGVPYQSQLLPNFGSILGTSGSASAIPGNPLAFINPADIESIDILKDADATAIYGARAANGAILITTKKGKAGTMHVSLNVQTGYGQVPRRLQLLNTAQYIAMRKETKMNDGQPIGDNDFDINGTWSDKTEHDWQKELIGGKANYNDAQVSLSGGSSNVQYLVGTGFHRETTVFPTDLADKKINVHFNVSTSSNDRRFSATFSGSFLNDDNRLPNIDLTKNAMTLAPNAPDLRKPDGSLNWGVNDRGYSTLGTSHPLAKITALYKSKTDNVIANAALNYNILRTLTFKTNIGYNSLSTDELITNPVSVWAPEYAVYVTRTASYGNNTVKTWLVEPQLSFEHQFSTSKLSALAGATVQQMNSNRKLINGTGYASDGVLENVGAATSVSIPPGFTIISRYKYNAGFFRINYNLEDKYILNLSGRRDGSSRYGSANRFHNFGAVGAAWLFSSEKFFSSLSKVIDFGKIRMSYGITGNDQIGDYTYLSLYNYNTPPVPYGGGSSLIQNKLSNPYVQWEETKKLSLGLDLGLFSDRILLTGNYFSNRSSNLIYFAQLPSTAGPRYLDVNLPAVVRNSGLEVLVNTVNISKKDFKWSSTFNITVSRNRLKRFDDLSTSIYATDFVIGQPINILKAYAYRGVDSKDGYYRYADQKGDLTDDPNADPANRTVVINRDPKFFGGFGNTISYKGIQLDFLFQFVKQVAPRYWPEIPGVNMVNQPASLLDRWQKPGDIKPFQKVTATDFKTIGAYYNMFNSDAFYVDGSYIRLKNVSLSWTLPASFRKGLSLENGRVFINAQNVLTITSYKGLDPESQSSVSLPPLRVLTAGFQLTF